MGVSSAAHAASGGIRALVVLELLAHSDQPATTAQIADGCAMSKASALALLERMRAAGFVEYDAQGQQWTLGVGVVELSAAFRRQRPLHRVSPPLLRELSERLHETSHLAVLDGMDVVYVGKQQPSGGAPQLVTEVGVRLPAHRTAVGLAMLSEQEERDVIRRYEGAAGVRIDVLADVLAAVRRDGYAIDDGMTTPGITCVAASVRDHDEAPRAAIGVTFVTAQRPAAEIQAISAAVRESADRLSTLIGGQARAAAQRRVETGPASRLGCETTPASGDIA